MSEKDRWQLEQSIIAERVEEILGDRVKSVFMALSKVEADKRTKSLPAVGILKANYTGEQPEETGVRSRGIATIGLLVYTQQNTNAKDAGVGEEILGLLRRKHPDGLIDFAPEPFSDESPFKMWLQDESLEDISGGLITQSASYAHEIWMTHAEG